MMNRWAVALKFGRRLFFAYFCLITSDLVWLPSVTAAPLSPVTLYVGYSPGGLADQLARYAATLLSDELQRPVQVKNFSGANGVRASTEVAQAGPENPSLLLGDTALVIAYQTVPLSASDPLKFLPIGTLGYTPFALTVAASSRITHLAELLDDLHKNPATANYGSPGIYSVHQLSAIHLLQKARIKAQHIPYQGGSQMLSDLITQRLTFGFLSIPLARQYESTLQLRTIAVTGPVRSVRLPHVPTLSETYPGMSAVSYAYLLAAPQTDPMLYRKISEAWGKILNKSAAVSGLQALGMEGAALDATATRAQIQKDTDHWRSVLNSTR